MVYLGLEFVSVDPPCIRTQALKESGSGGHQQWKLGKAFLVFSKDLAVVFSFSGGIAGICLVNHFSLVRICSNGVQFVSHLVPTTCETESRQLHRVGLVPISPASLLKAVGHFSPRTEKDVGLHDSRANRSLTCIILRFENQRRRP